MMRWNFGPFHWTGFQLAVHVAAWMPLLALLWDAWQGHLSVNPIQDMTYRTGKAAMVLLVATLAVTPAYILFRFRSGLKVRRALGLYAFGYAFLHGLIYVGVDYGWDFQLILGELGEKRYVLVGFLALLLLTPLAITSTRGWQRRLKQRWKKLHGLIYPAALLVMLHYIWVQKADAREPWIWAGFLMLLLLVRIPRVRRWFAR